MRRSYVPSLCPSLQATLREAKRRQEVGKKSRGGEVSQLPGRALTGRQRIGIGARGMVNATNDLRQFHLSGPAPAASWPFHPNTMRSIDLWCYAAKWWVSVRVTCAGHRYGCLVPVWVPGMAPVRGAGGRSRVPAGIFHRVFGFTASGASPCVTSTRILRHTQQTHCMCPVTG